MRKIVMFVLKVSIFFIASHANAQQPVLSVQSFEYAWERFSPDKSRLILASEDSANRAIKNAFAVALRNRWNIELPEASLSVKPLGIFSNNPKFNTRFKEKRPDTWYLFLQIFDKGHSSFLSSENTGMHVSTLQLKCRLIDGGSDSIILDRSMAVEVYGESPPPDQAILLRLPGHPRYFIQAFDSIAKWLFQPEDPGEKIIKIKPACVFAGAAPAGGSFSELTFASDESGIQHISYPSLLFKTPGPGYKKTDVRRNKAGNTATGVLNVFTGANISKSRVSVCSADFPFEESDSVYHCIINYAEREAAERRRETTRNNDGSKSYSLTSGSYELLERRTDSSFVNFITLGIDTVVTFRIGYISNSKNRATYDQYWDGSDSATIASLPKKWNNTWKEDDVIIMGQMGINSFSMKTVSEKNGKEFYIDDRIVLIVHGNTAPAKALLFRPMSIRELKIFTMLASLPYQHFNYKAY